MKTRLAQAGLSMLAAAGLVAGCAQNSADNAQPGASGSAAPTASSASSAARDALLASVQTLMQTTYKYRIASGGLTGQGSADPMSKAAMVSMTGTDAGSSVTIDMTALNTDFWLKLNLGSDNQRLGIATDKWLHIDAARLGANSTLPVDPTGGAAAASGLLGGVVDAQTMDNKHFTGTVDLTKATGSAVSADVLAKAGVKARSLPFTANLDSQGRLRDLTVDLSSIDPSLSLSTSYSDYGAPVTITRPDAASVMEAPDSVYKFFGR